MFWILLLLLGVLSAVYCIMSDTTNTDEEQGTVGGVTRELLEEIQDETPDGGEEGEGPPTLSDWDETAPDQIEDALVTEMDALSISEETHIDLRKYREKTTDPVPVKSKGHPMITRGGSGPSTSGIRTRGRGTGRVGHKKSREAPGVDGLAGVSSIRATSVDRTSDRANIKTVLTAVTALSGQVNTLAKKIDDLAKDIQIIKDSTPRTLPTVRGPPVHVADRPY